MFHANLERATSNPAFGATKFSDLTEDEFLQLFTMPATAPTASSAAAGHDLMGAIEVEPVPPAEGIPDTVRHWHTALGLEAVADALSGD